MRNDISTYFVEVIFNEIEFKTDCITDKERAVSIARSLKNKFGDGVFLMRRDSTVIAEETEIDF